MGQSRWRWPHWASRKSPFEGVINGNVWEFVRAKQIAISPLSPGRTLLHEIAHVVLGHTTEQDLPQTARSIREVEAEGVALFCVAALQLDGAKYSRGYLQQWLGHDQTCENQLLELRRYVEARGRSAPRNTSIKGRRNAGPPSMIRCGMRSAAASMSSLCGGWIGRNLRHLILLLD